MSFQQELASWNAPKQLETAAVPSKGSKAPATAKLPMPPSDGKPIIVTFLRHCGCPFAEKAFLSLRSTAEANPSLRCVAVSHSDDSSTKKWLDSVSGAGPIDIIVDHDREIYARWGLGVSGWGHIFTPSSLWSGFKLGKEEGIWNRPTESGSRWQTAGSFAVDGTGSIKWGSAAEAASDVPNFDDAAKALLGEQAKF